MVINQYESPVRYGANGDAIIRMRGITKTFRIAAGEATVLKGVDVDVLQGQFISVIGRSGSGKSTLVNMITGIDRPTSGTVEVGSRPIHKMHESEMAVWRGKNLGIVFQFFQLLPMLTLIENVMLPMDFCNIYSPASREERAMNLLRRVGLERLAEKLPGAVAGGQQQSAAMARALANDPPILIADEPTGNLDSHTAEQVMVIFEEMAAQGKTVLIVTHDRTLAQRTNRRLIISDGELIDEALAAAFPDAPHSLLLHLTQHAGRVRLLPGEPLPDASTELIYLVKNGEVVIGGGLEKNRIATGELLDLRSLTPDVSAGRQGAELLELPREDVLPLISTTGQVLAEPGSNGAVRPKFSWLRRTRGA